MKTDIILVTEKEYEKGRSVFAESSGIEILSVPSGEETLAEMVEKHGVRAVIVGVERYTGPLCENIAGGLIARFGVGHDGIDKELCRKHNVMLVNTPGVLDRSVAEHAFWLLGSLLRHVAAGDRNVRNEKFPIMTGSELYGKTILIIGTGPIGMQAARIAKFGFGMRVFATGRSSPEKFADRPEIDRYENDVDRLLPAADVVSLHLASVPETFHFMDRNRFEKMRPNAVLVNTARGALVDEIALYDVLKNRRIAGAALDVYENEPYRPVAEDFDLRTLDNVVLTPHLGSSTVEANHRMAESSLRSVTLFLEGRGDEIGSRIV